MQFESSQTFTLLHAGPPDEALAFVRDPARALHGVRFLRDLQADPSGVRGELLVSLPVLGEVDLPFHSLLHVTPDGASLTPQPLLAERAWVEVHGQARATPDPQGTQLHFQFQFRAHLATPDAEGWGGQAFEKMVRAAAQRTLERVARDLPTGIQASLDAAGEQ